MSSTRHFGSDIYSYGRFFFWNPSEPAREGGGGGCFFFDITFLFKVMSNVYHEGAAVQNIGGFVCNLGESGWHLPQFPDINRGPDLIYWGNDYTSW